MPDDFWGTTLAPNDASLPTLRGDFDAGDTACFTGGTFPADGAAVTTWINKAAGGVGVNLTTGGSGPFYRANSLGYRGLELTPSSSRSLAAASFFHTGYTWSSGATIFIVLRVSSTLSSQIIFASGNNLFRLLLNWSSTTAIGWANQAAFLRSNNGWAVIGASRTIPAPVPESRVFMSGDFALGSGLTAALGTPVANDSLNFGSGFTGSGTTVVNRLLIYQGSMSHTRMLRVGWHLMQAVNVPRRPRTIVSFGNSVTEMTGGADVGCWPVKINSQHLNAAGIPCEVINLSKSGGTSATLGLQATLRDAVESLWRDDGRRAVATLFHGHNDGLWSPAVQTDYQSYLSGWRSNGHRSICSPVTPYTGIAQVGWDNSRAWVQANGLTHHDGVVYHHTETWADSMADPGANAGGAWVDNVHMSDTGRTLFAALWQAEVARQFRAITARLCIPSSPGSGQVALTRPGHDDAAMPVSLLLVPTGSSAPNGSETPTLTLNVGEFTKSAAATNGTYDAYAWSSTGPVMPLGNLQIGSGGPLAPSGWRTQATFAGFGSGGLA